MAPRQGPRRPRQSHAGAPASPSARVDPGREHLAVLARQLVVEPRVRLLRRHRRPLLRRVEPPHRPALDHHVHRPPGLGQCMRISAGWYNVSSDPSSARLPNRRDHGGSLHPFGSGIPSSPRPCPPHYRAAFACSAAPLPPPPSPALRSGYRRLAATGRVGLTLLSNGEKRMGRLRPIVRRVTVPPSSRVPFDDPTRMPFWLRPISTFGRFSMTDLNHGRSLAFSHSSSARPPPDWCSQIVAVVPKASHVGLLLRMSG